MFVTVWWGKSMCSCLMWHNFRCFMIDVNSAKNIKLTDIQPWASCSHLCASLTKLYNLVPVTGWWRSSAGKVTAGLAESNGSLPLGMIKKVTCGLTASKPGSALGPRLGNECGRTLHLSLLECKLFTLFLDKIWKLLTYYTPFFH